MTDTDTTAPTNATDAAHERDLAELKNAILAKLMLAVGKDAGHATNRDWFVAAALVARDRVIHRHLAAERSSRARGKKHVYYLSLEFLIGRVFNDVLSNLGLREAFHEALGDLGVDLNRLIIAEPDAALGNGGLGRLAACFMESLATLGIPAYGYGIRYDHGLFRQVIVDGNQEEFPEGWLAFGNPWEFARPEVSHDVHFGGRVEAIDDHGVRKFRWTPTETIVAVAYDTLVAGWRGRHVNPLRLWSARAPDPLRLELFNSGDHVGALSEQSRAEAISKVLYPSDESPSGQELRLRQEYLFVSASLQDLVNRHIQTYGDVDSLPQRVAIQLNDTHPSIAVAELMRLLVDMHGLAWDEAWQICVQTFSYTNHTLMAEALESWPLQLFERLLPRHLQIIYFINALHLDAARHQFPGDLDILSALSIIDERGGRRLRMGHLAFVGSHAINGVSALHTDLMKKTVFRDLARLYPGRIENKTNGITFRRWLFQSNPRLTRLLCDICGEGVLDDPDRILRLADYADDSSVQERITAIKLANKASFSRFVSDHMNVRLDPTALFDVQIKRIHEYKRQLLNILETVALYDAIRAEPGRDWVPRVKIFAGKAAASYVSAKRIIKLANDVARTINDDPAMRDRLKVVFLPNYNVSLAQRIIPAADLSEQISTAGLEASGTGNMKLSLNGALTIGTLDGANVEICENVGAENIFIFGLTADEVLQTQRSGWSSAAAIAASPRLTAVIDAIESGAFSPDEPSRFFDLMQGLRWNDRFMVTADFDAYWSMQRHIDDVWQSRSRWAAMVIRNVANMAYFSSDRTIAEYARSIWNVPIARS